MALILENRVQETATPNTTVSFTLTGAVAGFQSFAIIGNGNTTYYSATDASGNWEVGVGLYLATGTILVRTTIYASSNSGSAVTFSGVVNVFVTLPSGSAVYEDVSGNVSPLGTISSGTWQGSTIGVAYGGTGVTASSGANSVVLRDANENITVNRINQGLQTITASGGTTTLTAASDFNQALVGTGGQTFRLPDATTLTDTTTFQFNNNATGTLTIENNAGTAIGTVASGGAAGIALLSNATVGGTWDVHAYIPEGVTWGTNALNLGTTVISNGTWQGGTIQSGYGGTGLTTFAGANNALYSTSASNLVAGTLPVAAGGTGLTSYTLNGVVYANATNTLTTGSNLTYAEGGNNQLTVSSASASYFTATVGANTSYFGTNGTGTYVGSGTNIPVVFYQNNTERMTLTSSGLSNSGVYTAPSNGAGAGTKTTITGSTGTGQAGTTGGNGFIELIGGGGTSAWTSFAGFLGRRRGGINLQAGTAQADAGGTYVSGSSINITGSNATNNGVFVGAGSAIVLTAGGATKVDGNLSGGGTVSIAGGGSLTSGSLFLGAGAFSVASGTNNGASITANSANSVSGGNVLLAPGLASASGSTSGKAYVTDPATSTNNEILTTGNITTAAITAATANSVPYFNGSKVLTTGSALTFDGTSLGIGTTNPLQKLVVSNAGAQGLEISPDAIASAPSLVAYNRSGGAYVQLTAAALQHVWQISGTGKMHLDSQGLGIGTNSPVTELDVVGDINLTGTVYGTEFSGIYFSGPYNFYAGISAANSGFDLVLQAGGGTEQARLTATGLVMAATAAITSARINPRVSTDSSTASITPNIQANDQYNVTALATALTINAPTGTPVDGNKLTFRLLDNGTARALTWDATYTAIGTVLPATTTANKTTYVGCSYNAFNARWDVIAVTTQA